MLFAHHDLYVRSCIMLVLGQAVVVNAANAYIFVVTATLPFAPVFVANAQTCTVRQVYSHGPAIGIAGSHSATVVGKYTNNTHEPCCVPMLGTTLEHSSCFTCDAVMNDSLIYTG